MRRLQIAGRGSVRVAGVAAVLGVALWTGTPVQAGLTYEQVIMSDSPTAYWRFEESSTSDPAADTATGDGAQNGTYIGTATLVPGIVGQALNVDPAASGGEVSAPGVNMTRSFTAETWAISETANWNALGWLTNDRGANGFLTHPTMNSRSWQGYLMNNAAQHEQIGSHTPADIQQWHHYAITYDDATKTGRMYFDGVAVATNASMTSVRDATSTINVHMGRDGGSSGWDRKGDGSLDEVAIYNSALGPDRIRAHYFAPSGLAAFSGASDPNLDFSGYFVYAVNVGDLSGNVGATIGNATFTGQAVSGVEVNAENTIFPGWGSKPEYGSSPDDDALESIMHSIRYDSSGNAALPGIEVNLDVTPGKLYLLQLLFSENGYTTPGSRAFNIKIEDEMAYANLDGPAVTGPWSGNPTLGVVFTKLIRARDDKLNILLDPGTIYANHDAILNAFTLELVPEPSTLVIFGLGAVVLLPLGPRFRRKKKT